MKMEQPQDANSAAGGLSDLTDGLGGNGQCLAAWTPTRYAGDYPPVINLSTARPKPGSGEPLHVLLTVRQPTVFGAPPGETTTVLMNKEMWTALLALISQASKTYDACDALDALY